MVAKCVNFYDDVYTPPGKEPIPMLACQLDVEGIRDLIKVQISKKKIEGTPHHGKVALDFEPRFASGGKLYWKPSLLRFFPEGEDK